MNDVFNYNRLRGKIREVYGTEADFAEALGIGRVSLSKRLNNSADFTRNEMLRTCDLLHIAPEDTAAYFFAKEVQNHEHR